MNPINFALRRPATLMVVILGLVLGSVLAVVRMPVDIFPNLNLPVIYVIQAYGGMDPAQMEGLLTNYYEYHFLYISGIHHVESRNIQSSALMKLYFHPGTDMAQAMAETIAYVNRSRSFMPAGTVPPDVVRFDTGSVPVGYLVLSSASRSVGEIQDLALFRVRPIFASLPGVSAPPPFGGNQRTLVVQVDPDRLRSYNLSPDDVVAALKSGNSISPSGTARIKDQMPIVPVNSMVRAARELGSIPLRLGENVYLRDVARIEDSTDIPAGETLVDGRRAVFMLVTKRADASTLTVVNEVKASLPAMKAVLPQDIDLRFEFDQSPYVTQSIEGVGREGLLGAVLTGLMVLLFLRDWRTVIVVVLNIPIALLTALLGLWLTGQTINLMTLGGLALAVGILVDMSTVEVENIHTHLDKAPSVARAALRSNGETAVPRLLAMLCVLAVFLPSFFMEGAAREMFVPLSLAVGFAMVAAYFLSSTFVPVLSAWMLRPHDPDAGEGTQGRFSFARFRSGYARVLGALVAWRWVLVGGYLLGSGLVIVLLGSRLGLEIFPRAEAGEFQLRLRAPDGTRMEVTGELVGEAIRLVRDETKEETGADRVAIAVGYCGLHPTSYTINNMYLWMRGPEEAVLRVKLNREGGLDLERLKERLRETLPRRLGDWFRQRLRKEGLPEASVARRLRGLRFSFEPADVVNQIMSFGSPTPIEIAVSGPNFSDNQAYARKVFAELSKIPSLRDVQFGQSLDYPAVAVKIDREKAGLSGVTAAGVARSLVSATSSSRFVEPIFWADPATGIGYYTQVEIPPYRMDAPEQIGMVPLRGEDGSGLLVRDVAEVCAGTMPGEYDRYNMRRLVSITANIHGEDLGRVVRRVNRAIQAAGDPPRGTQVDVRGQAVPMQQMFRGLTVGLALAMVVIILLLTAYYQSLRLAIVSASTIPGVLAGVVVALTVTGTTLNIQSFMGTIMGIGVATANAILLLTFAERNRRDGMTAAEAAVEGARSRLRPILMTSLAMLAGMVPMALALGEGGEQTAPLGRAVIGGLGAATLATLIVLPSIFALIQGRATTLAPSLHPDDPESRLFDHHVGQAARTASGIGGQVEARSSPPLTPPDHGWEKEGPPFVRGSELRAARPDLFPPWMRGGQGGFFRDGPHLRNPIGYRWIIGLSTSVVLLSGIAGCQDAAPPPPESSTKVLEVAVVRPARTSLRWTVQQPGSIQAYEETPIVPRIAGYVQKWNVDIGDRVKKGQVLATLWVPDLVKELEQKRVEVEQARKMCAVAEARVGSAAARVEEARAAIRRAEANVTFRQMQHDRARELLKSAVINKRVEEETWNESRSAEAGVMEAKAQLARAEADARESQAVRDKSRVDIAVAQAALERMQALVDYATLRAPFDGVIGRRNVNTGGYVQPPGAAQEPLYVVQRRDLMRIFVEVPEADAVWVKDGASALIRIPILKDRTYTGTVKRMSYSLKRQSRTLLAEIDLPNPEDLLRPGMYASATIQVERPDVLSLPAAAVASAGDVNQGYQDYCFLLEGGKVRRTPILVGSRGADRVQVLKKQVRGAWVDLDGKEQVVRGELSSLADGQEVQIAGGEATPTLTAEGRTPGSYRRADGG